MKQPSTSQQPDNFENSEADSTVMESAAENKRRQRWRLLSSSMLLGLIVMCAVAAALAVAGLGGLAAGQKERQLHATQTTVADLDLQYELGVQDLEQGEYTLAAQRFQWILSIAPEYPGAGQKLAEAQRLDAESSLPTATPLPPSEADTLSERYQEARQLYDSGDLETAIVRLQEIQAIDPTYNEVEVKEMLYSALTTLGLQYVRGDRLEEGIILLEQAKGIRPLDDQAAGELYYATLYTTGSTYWNLNWPIVIDNFEALYDVVPQYRDVFDRLVTAHMRYGDQLAVSGAQCDAAEQYQEALSLRSDPEVRDKLDEATEACENPTPTPSPTVEGDEGEGIPDAETSPTPTQEGEVNTIPEQ